MKVSVLTILVFLLAAGFPFVALSGPALDVDSDTVLDVNDNCLTDPNGGQCDTDQDGYGNACDGDVNNDGTTDVADYTDIDNNILGTSPPGADTDCNGVIDVGDYPRVDNNILNPPGPSGLACAGTAPCP
jgi:hypothetical protein